MRKSSPAPCYLAHRPMLFTTDKPLAALGAVLHDGDLAEAILDRLLERGRHMRGRSYRTRHLIKEEDDHSEEPANPV
ncbi:MAG TPA: ATP-binding protein [Gemmatimonadales bacterium]|nr:ATP-binding protein [Gemmatimonadales bacterium]